MPRTQYINGHFNVQSYRVSVYSFKNCVQYEDRKVTLSTRAILFTSCMLCDARRHLPRVYTSNSLYYVKFTVIHQRIKYPDSISYGTSSFIKIFY